MGSKDKRNKADKAAKKADKAAKKAEQAHKRRAKGLARAHELGDGGSKKAWRKVAKLLDVDCCTPTKRKCKKCVLEEALEGG